VPSLHEVIDKIEEVGLVVQKNPSKHSHTMWDIIDPKSGTVLTGISGHANKQGGDLNWHFNIRRILRKAGYHIEFGREQKKNRKGHKKKPAIDLDALKKAQEQAAAAGQRVPLIDDLEDDSSFLTRVKVGPNSDHHPFTSEATGEAIHNMAAEDAPRIKASIARLRTLLERQEENLVERAKTRATVEGKKYTSPSRAGTARSEFVRIAIEEVAPKRNLRAWKTPQAGYQLLYTLLEKGKSTSLWSIELIEATMDHLDGLKWGEIDETKIRSKPESAPKKEKKEKAPDTSTSPQEGPDQTTYDLAVALVDEYEEVFRKIAETAGADGTDPDDWKAVTHKAQAANLAVIDLRKDHDEALNELEAARVELPKQIEAVKNLVDQELQTIAPSVSISGQYATVLLKMLESFDTKGSARGYPQEEEKKASMLELILTRLDKLAGI